MGVILVQCGSCKSQIAPKQCFICHKDWLHSVSLSGSYVCVYVCARLFGVCFKIFVDLKHTASVMYFVNCLLQLCLLVYICVCVRV